MKINAEALPEAKPERRMTTFEDVLAMRERLNGDGNANCLWGEAVQVGREEVEKMRRGMPEFELGKFDGSLNYLDRDSEDARHLPRVEGAPTW